MKDKFFITKKQKETYSSLWEKVNQAPSSEVNDEMDYLPSGNEERVEKKIKANTLSQEEAIAYSSKIIGALRRRQKDHNSEFNTKVQFSKIKEAYRTGILSRTEGSEKTCNQWGMANVNAFLAKLDEPDFEKADQDIEKYNIDVSFNNLEDLYLEEYSPINKVY